MITTYLTYCEKVKNLTPRTLEEYKKDLHVFTEWLDERHATLRQVTKTTVDAYLMDEHDRGMKPETIKKRLTAVRMFFQWASREGYMAENPAKWCQSPKNAQTLPKVADSSALDIYLNTPILGPRSLRVHKLVSLLLDTGLRLGEAMRLTWADVDPTTQTIRVTGKGRKERYVFFGHRFAKYVDPTALMSDYVLQFDGERTLRRELSAEVGRYVPGIHPHMLRHTFATSLLNNGCPLKDCSVLMGHAHVATTERYTHVALSRIKTAYEQYQP